MDVKLICAEAAHEANRLYCQSIGDNSQPAWADAPDWQKTSAINGVQGVFDGNTPKQSHESWLAEKKVTGWRYGKVKDPEKKTHPCFVPYDKLPPEQKMKDLVYVTVVRSIAAALAALPVHKAPARDTVIGVAHPLKTDHLPKLDELPVHKALDD